MNKYLIKVVILGVMILVLGRGSASAALVTGPIDFAGSALWSGNSAVQLTGGNILIAYTASQDSNKGRFVIYDSTGSTELVASTQFSAIAYAIKAVSLSDGTAVIFYKNGPSGQGKFRTVDADGNLSVEDTFTASNLSSNRISAARLSGGNLVVTYNVSNTGYFRVFDGTMTPLTGEVSFAGNIIDHSTVPLTNGNFMVTYRNDSANGAFQIYSADGGTQVLEETEFNAGFTNRTYANLLSNGNVLIAYYDDTLGNRYFVVLDDDGNEVVSETLISSGDDSVSVTGLSAGGAIIAYPDVSDSNKLKFKTFDNSGNLIDGPTSITTGGGGDASVLQLSGANVLFSYYDSANSDHGTFSIYGSGGGGGEPAESFDIPLSPAVSTIPYIATTTLLINITVPVDPTVYSVDFSAILEDDRGNWVAAVDPAVSVTTAITGGTAEVDFPASLQITGPDTWEGLICMPKERPNSSVSLDLGAEKVARIKKVIEVGCSGDSLTFDKAVRILLPEQGTFSAGHATEGVGTKIETTCNADDQATVDAQLEGAGECSIVVDSDLVIWTTHFTSFFGYAEIDGSVASNVVISQAISEEISLGLEDTALAMSESIPGLTGGTATANTDFSVITNNAAGYKVELAMDDADGDMVGPNINSVQYVIPGYTGGGNTWTVGANEAFFGYSTNTTSWWGGSNSAFVIETSPFPTTWSPASSTLYFKVEIASDPSPLISEGMYYATTTITATML